MPAITRVIPAGDLALDERGTFKILRDNVREERLQWIRQRIIARFNFFLGEWFLDLRLGIPYYRDVFVARPNLAVIRSLFRRVILGTPGVVALPKFTLRFERGERKLYFDFHAQTEAGDIVVTPEDEEFIVAL
ncbi:MAG: hypothetical protein DIU78_019860 [Pseudomonadota bacterium]|nr:MAG: hypothetical protein DIU78_25330 [Pseudomonadota bacterium]